MGPSDNRVGSDSPGAPTLAPLPVMIATGHFLFRHRNLLFPLVAIPLLVATPPIHHSGGPSVGYVLDAWGIALVAGGQVLRMAVIGFRYIRRGGKEGRIHADTLVQEGFFALSRNPLYLGNMMALVGFCLIHDAVLCYVVAIPGFLFAYLAIVLAEEDYLRRRFGRDFEEYCRRVNRFVPSLSGLRLSLEGQEFRWKRVVRKEYNSTALWATLVLLLIGWDHWMLRGWEESRGAILTLAILWVVVVIAYVIAWSAKRVGLLGGARAIWPKGRIAKAIAAHRESCGEG